MQESTHSVAQSIHEAFGKFEDVRKVPNQISEHMAKETSELAITATLCCAMIAHEEAIQGLEALIDCRPAKTELKLAAV